MASPFKTNRPVGEPSSYPDYQGLLLLISFFNNSCKDNVRELTILSAMAGGKLNKDSVGVCSIRTLKMSGLDDR